ncbi:GNAT family N-acetyltransferase [Sphingomonas xinjiangensis]|uniref:RimJ/RimL family protein N-acetyltransferase n=1 Tax=Sphingomonas xinjiangensis TaxID=643568 RepID=A0A840YSB8_9SPHN|nr:GNAT family N-acetyltransferase [Sphingomonas xinjiangensis]MBB5712564.1 RimJ/RimL family protein N-acetyltransferase [Sphingomonas xinjiangensis]
MSDFPRAILNYWHEAFDGPIVGTKGDFALTVVPTLNRKRPAMILEGQDGSVRAALTPELTEAIGAFSAGEITVAGLRERLAGAGIVLHSPDFLFYFPDDTMPAADRSRAPRQLTEGDRESFNAFQAEASEQDLEDAYVELDHWAAFGYFDGDRLVSAASAYPWENSQIADIGVLTLPDVRGKGYARAVVQAIIRFSKRQGYEPQYRCQLDNHASVALAKACGLTLFGRWTVASGAS